MCDAVGDLNPYVRVAMNQRCRPGYRLARRVILDHYLACVTEGVLLADIDGRRVELQAGQFVFIEPGVEHAFWCYDNVATYLPHIHFDFFARDDADHVFVSFKTADRLTAYRHLFREPIGRRVAALRLESVIEPAHYEQPLGCLMRIIALQGQSSPAAELERQGCFFQLFGLLVQACQAGTVYRNPRHLRAMEHAMAVIRNDFDRPLGLEDLAAAVHLSVSHFSSLFRQFYRSSPMQFLRNYRIEQVKRRLLTTDKSLTQISGECGFSSAGQAQPCHSRACSMVSHRQERTCARPRLRGCVLAGHVVPSTALDMEKPPTLFGSEAVQAISELKYDDHGLIPAIVQDVQTREVLMMAYMNEPSLRATIETGKTHFWSRSRRKYWMKGESSGHTQQVHAIYTDCDKDTLLIAVTQTGGAACHEGYRSCFSRKLDPGDGWRRVGERVFDPANVYGSK